MRHCIIVIPRISILGWYPSSCSWWQVTHSRSVAVKMLLVPCVESSSEVLAEKQKYFGDNDLLELSEMRLLKACSQTRLIWQR